MGMRINTNTTSLAAQRSLGKVTQSSANNMEKLASGSRINSSSDDAAGLAISEQLKADIRSSRQATRNAGDGISMIQTAEGGMNEVSNILVRLRELSLQSASDTVGDTERGFSDKEYQNLTKELERISQSTEFNGTKLLNGEGDNLDFQIGINNDEFQDRIQYETGATNVTASALGVDGSGVASKGDAQDNLEKLDTAISSVNANRSVLGALQNRLQSTISNLEVKTENLSAANSRIRDTDVAEVTANLTRDNIVKQASVSVLSQANNAQQGALRLIG